MNVTVGRTVNYVLQNGEIRPLVVVRVWEGSSIPGYINGVLIYDGTNDSGQLSQGAATAACVQWITSTHFDEAKTPGTWHWPVRVSNGSN